MPVQTEKETTSLGAIGVPGKEEDPPEGGPRRNPLMGRSNLEAVGVLLQAYVRFLVQAERTTSDPPREDLLPEWGRGAL